MWAVRALKPTAAHLHRLRRRPQRSVSAIGVQIKGLFRLSFELICRPHTAQAQQRHKHWYQRLRARLVRNGHHVGDEIDRGPGQRIE